MHFEIKNNLKKMCAYPNWNFQICYPKHIFFHLALCIWVAYIANNMEADQTAPLGAKSTFLMYSWEFYRLYWILLNLLL